jgi:hypothetical protein
MVRMIMTLVIALSVAILPAAGSAVSIANPASKGASEAMSKDMTRASDMSSAMNECCPDHAKTRPCDRSSEQCPMAPCAAQPVNIASAAVLSFDLPFVMGQSLPIPVDQVVALYSGSPPFRPPRV